jgi:subtilisin family serine protease
MVASRSDGGACKRMPRCCIMLVLSLLFFALPASAQERPRLDAALQRLLQPEVRARIGAHGLIRPGDPSDAQPFAGAYSLDTDAQGRTRIAAFVEVAASDRARVLDELRRAGAEIGAIIGDFAVVRVPLDRIELLDELPVQRAEAARVLRHTHDSSMVATGAHLVRQRTATGWTGVTGRGTLIGIIDSGLDITHADFRDDNGVTRVVGVWDQITGSRPPTGFTYGFHCTQSAVQTVITTGDLAPCPTSDLVGHGTHVAGTAAGSGAAGPDPFRYAGMAPEAELLIVRAGNATFTEDRVVDGMVWLQREAQARGRPLAANLSLGHQYGPHDGSLLFERMLDELSGPGFIIVAAAGNDGANMNTVTPPSSTSRLIHARAFTRPSVPASVQFQVTPYTPNANLCTGNFIDLSAWYDARDRVEITVVRPDGTHVVAPAGTAVINDSPAGRVQIQNAAVTQSFSTTVEGAIQISGCGSSGAPAAGVWTVTFHASDVGGGNAPVDLYINNFRLGPGGSVNGGAGFDNRFVIGSPGNALRVITVGAFTTRTCWPALTGTMVCYAAPSLVGDLAPFSSGGPTRDGRQKPEISAPGAAIISALSRQTNAPPARTAPGGTHWALEGTSMAAPHVTGAVALLLQQRPGLTPEDTRDVLMRSARQDAFTQRTYDAAPGGRPADWWGAGKLDVPAALAELLGGGTVAVVRVEPGRDTIPVGGTVQLRAAARDAAGEPVFANIDWTSLDPGIATVSAHGMVRGIAPGTARIVAMAGTAADTAIIVVQPAAVLTLRARPNVPAQPVQSPEGTLLPLLALTAEARGPEAVELRSLGFELSGYDPAARLVLIADADGEGVIDTAPRIIAARDVALTGEPLVVVLNTDTIVIPRNTTRHFIVALELSGSAPSGATFAARLLPQGTRTMTANSRVADRFELAGTLASGAAETTVLRPGELFAMSENPVRGDAVLFNVAAQPTLASVYTATGSRVVDLLPRFDGLSLRWDLTNDAGTRVVPGVYFLVFRIDDQLVRQRLIVVSPNSRRAP